MLHGSYRVLLVTCILFLMVLSLSACGDDSGAQLDGKKVLETQCVECHNLSRVRSASMTREEWARNLDRMISLGAELSPEERDILLDYLEVTYP